jgi:pyruvate/2-oxoglutarate dehydrogenase complex dihydrolipoamide acyltransferase (E2) component
MKVDMTMPQMGESITEATISRWLKQPGDRVERDEIILEISTDKVDSEIPAPASGVLEAVLFREGDVVPVHEKIAIISQNGSVTSLANAQATSQSSAPAVQQRSELISTEDDSSGPKFISPVVKSLAQQHGVSAEELKHLEGSGQGGRVTKQDFLTYLDSRGQQAAPLPAPVQTQPGPSSQSQTSVSLRPTPAPAAKPTAGKPMAKIGEWDEEGFQRIPMDTMRQAIAAHMVRSKATSPHVYSVQEVDVSAISKWRTAHKGEFAKKEGFNLSFTPFFLEATVKALLQFPYVNASVEDKTVILKRHVNLGCAVALPNAGLIVPVIKQAEERNLVGLARSLNDLAIRARDKKLLPNDVQGGTFTVTNPGVFGTIIGNPIINQPQVAILCLGAIKKRPVVVDDMIAIREMCYLTLSYDHRIIDGSMGGQFLAFVREYLENWDMNRKLY